MKRLLTNKDLIKSVSGIITEMAPGMKPRNLQAIVDYVDKYFREDCKDKDGYYKSDRLVMFYIEEDDIRDFIDKLLKSCKEFNDLNLSQDEIDRGITVDDPSRPQWVVGGASDGSHLKEYYDFIDLDACVRNITNDLYWAFLDNDLFEQRCEIIDTKIEKYEEGETVLYRNGSRFELGIVKRVCGDDEYFINYHTGDTAARTHARNLHKVANAYAFHIIRLDPDGNERR